MQEIKFLWLLLLGGETISIPATGGRGRTLSSGGSVVGAQNKQQPHKARESLGKCLRTGCAQAVLHPPGFSEELDACPALDVGLSPGKLLRKPPPLHQRLCVANGLTAARDKPPRKPSRRAANAAGGPCKLAGS